MKYIASKNEIRKDIIKQVKERPGVIFLHELCFIEQDLERLEKLENEITTLYNKYKKLEKNDIVNCEKCQQSKFNLGAFMILKVLKEML